MENIYEKKCENCLEKAKLEYEHYKCSIEDNGRYSSIIGSIFFVSTLTVFTFVSSSFNEIQKQLFTKWYIISLSFFVINEIINMIRNYFDYRYKNQQWGCYYSGQQSLNDLNTNVNKYTHKIYYKSTLIWFILFLFSLFAGFVAVLILLDVAFNNNFY